MIPVEPAPEPPSFDANVRQKGLTWLQEKGLTKGPAPEGTEFPAYWRDVLPALRTAYGETCAYVCLHIPIVTGASSADHYVAKSHAVEHAYEWTNYRLACAKMNSRKRDFLDVLDPFEVRDGWFELEFAALSIAPAKGLDPAIGQRVADTIRRLNLDDEECRTARAAHWNDYLSGEVSEGRLARHAPLVHREAKRQGLL